MRANSEAFGFVIRPLVIRVSFVIRISSLVIPALTDLRTEPVEAYHPPHDPPRRGCATTLDYSSEAPPDALPKELLWLALPVVVENMLHMMVGLTDVYLASHLPAAQAADATASVGSVSYVLWLIGLIAGAIGTGSTAIIARAIGAKHQSLANSVCGQSVTAAVLIGLLLTAILVIGQVPIAVMTGLTGQAYAFSLFYIRILSLSLPFSILMYAASACLRGAGDSVTPAISMIVVDVVNMGSSAALARGWWGLPVMGFRGIAIGTVIAYVVGGVLLFAVLVSGRGKLRLFLHRLRPHWTTLKRIFRIGIPQRHRIAADLDRAVPDHHRDQPRRRHARDGGGAHHRGAG